MTTRYVSGGATAAAVIKKTSAITVVADAYISTAPGPLWPAAESILGEDFTLAGNIILGQVSSINFSAYAIIKKSGTTITFVAAAIIVPATKQRTFWADSIIIPVSQYRFIATPNVTDSYMVVELFQRGTGIVSTILESYATGSYHTIYTSPYSTFNYSDYTAPIGVAFRYRFTSYDAVGAVVLTGESSDISMNSDTWSLSVPEYVNLVLDVTDSSYERQVQTETFSPLGMNNKTTLMGSMLGRRGDISIFVKSEDRVRVLNVLQDISVDTRPAYLRNPFGLVLQIVIGSVSEQRVSGGHSSIRISYIENGAA